MKSLAAGHPAGEWGWELDSGRLTCPNLRDPGCSGADSGPDWPVCWRGRRGSGTILTQSPRRSKTLWALWALFGPG